MSITCVPAPVQEELPLKFSSAGGGKSRQISLRLSSQRNEIGQVFMIWVWRLHRSEFSS